MFAKRLRWPRLVLERVVHDSDLAVSPERRAVRSSSGIAYMYINQSNPCESVNNTQSSERDEV
jgi:hypothetical protein